MQNYFYKFAAESISHSYFATASRYKSHKNRKNQNDEWHETSLSLFAYPLSVISLKGC